MNHRRTADRSHSGDGGDDWLLDWLSALLPGQWDTLLECAAVPVHFISGGTAPQATRAAEVMRWSHLSLNNQCALLGALAKVQLDLAPEVERRLAQLRSPRTGTDGRLAELHKQLDLARAAGDTAAIARLRDEILRLKHEKRAAGQIHAGDVLGRDDDGRYELLECLGKGGFATVWKAYDRQARRFVAVKVLHAEHARDESRRDRFFRGARQMAALDHTGIVRVFEPHAEDHGWHYFVMELIEGEDLDAAVRGGRVTAEQGLALVLEVADALRYAHGRGLFHRDVAPSNILVDRERRAHLADFDLVRAEDSVGGTRTSMLGRYIYAAPELLSHPQDADARTDVFALGMTLVFVYAGKPLHDGVLYEQDAYLASLACPPDVRLVVAHAIKRRMDERFDSVAAFAQALRASLSPGDRPHEDSALSVAVEQPQDVPAVVHVVPPVVIAGRPATPKPGDVWSEPETGLTLVWIPPGEFLMGSSKTKGEPGYEPEAFDDETPPRRVKLSAGFWIGQHPVTNERYGRFLARGVQEPEFWRNRRFNAPQQPVVGVSFEDALAFCAWATKHAGLSGDIGFQLATEAEWEYAARSEQGRRYPWGNATPTPERAVWGLDWEKDAAAPIGQRPQGATPLGVHDMAGNVWEWCLDGWRDSYPSLSTVDLDPCAVAHRAAPRVVRGGSWSNEARSLRCATRLRSGPTSRYLNFGFRLVCRRFRQHVDEGPGGDGDRRIPRMETRRT